MSVTICRAFHFNAAHRLHHPHWTPEKNQEIFGKCSNPNYHGHNYELIVKITGEIDPDTGFVMDIKLLKSLVEEKVTGRFDHKNLNLDLPEFAALNPTAENIAVVIYDLLKPHILQKLMIILYETERNFVEYSGTSPGR
ncbi:6-carboxytetrahydropterin synthase [Mucilaginibacter sp. 14171R-50]|nr:6-carboxytetrahydropterin synthase [Mucilaginibacter sp. 14171R-50]